MTNISYTSSKEYPVVPVINIGGKKIKLSLIEMFAGLVSTDAYGRLQDFTDAKRLEALAEGNQNPFAGPFLADLATLAEQHSHALLTLRAIAEGKFPSTEENPQYAGNTVSEGNRIFTPQEAARNALESMENVQL